MRYCDKVEFFFFFNAKNHKGVEKERSIVGTLEKQQQTNNPVMRTLITWSSTLWKK